MITSSLGIRHIIGRNHLIRHLVRRVSNRSYETGLTGSWTDPSESGDGICLGDCWNSHEKIHEPGVSQKPGMQLWNLPYHCIIPGPRLEFIDNPKPIFPAVKEAKRLRERDHANDIEDIPLKPLAEIDSLAGQIRHGIRELDGILIDKRLQLAQI